MKTEEENKKVFKKLVPLEEHFITNSARGTTICTHCLKTKGKDDFYKNPKKINGLESHCKECVLKRKANKYKKTKRTNKDTKSLKPLKRNNVFVIDQCTFNNILINRPDNNHLNEFLGGIQCYQDIQLISV